MSSTVGDGLFAVDTGRGTPIVFVHGLSETHDAWRFQREVLAQGFRVIACDVRGHGRSPTGAGEGTPEQLAADVAATMSRLSVDAAHVVGFSMGGVIAQRLALDFPARVLSVILVASSSKCNAGASQFFLDRMRTAETEGLQGIRALNATDAPGCLSPGRTDLIPAYTALRVSAIRDAAGYLNACRAMRTMYERPLTPELAAITVPALVVAGEHDPYCPPKASEIIAGQIPGARLDVIPAVGHCLHWEAPAAFNGMLESFVRSVGR